MPSILSGRSEVLFHSTSHLRCGLLQPSADPGIVFRISCFDNFYPRILERMSLTITLVGI